MVRFNITALKECCLPDYTVFILRFIFFASVHSLCAIPRVKQLSGGHGTESAYYRLLYNITSIVMFGWVMSAYHHSAILYFVPGVWSLIMYFFQFVTGCIVFYCVKQTGITDFFGLRQLRKEPSQDHLNTKEFYSVVRHPMYLFSLFFLILNPVMSTQWLLLILFSSIYFIIGAIVEEKRLLKQFGEEYRQYQHTVPFMFPSLKRIIPQPGART